MDSNKFLKKYPVMQLKKILSKFNREKKLGIKVISKKRKDEVVNYLLYYKYNLSNLPEIEKQQTRTSNILKRFNTKAYNDEEQEQFLNKGYEVKNPLESKKEYYNTKTNKEERLTLLEHQKKFFNYITSCINIKFCKWIKTIWFKC